ncbi:hypothetical protein CEE55_22440 [Stenotrophomonas pavanii]|uniref:Uncharacterized protein n=1 Tax=Stenotrophomonas pavanii TaxID=487698 RepID=A0A246KQL0_9GAMM|nr:hypothetical protein [Stenotrophomonas pavanii]OWR25643.1 hypothetical protein CEE55_22440 [Stenotrophomonas pavanii]
MSGVVHLIPNNALCVDRETLVARIREMADRVEEGEFGDVDRVCIVIDTPGALDYRVYGRATDAATLVGLLEWVKAKVMGVIR